MSWMQKLFETYESCSGREPEGGHKLMPIAHTTQQAHIEVVLDGSGAFRRASVVDKGNATTLIPCTEESGGRAGSKPVNHPLCDKLQYIAGDFLSFGGDVTSGFASSPEEPHRLYCESLKAWVGSPHKHPKVEAIQRYVVQGRLVGDLVRDQVLPVGDDRKLLKQWAGDKESAPAIYRALPAGQLPAEAFIRWSVETMGEPASGTWEDASLIQAWIEHYAKCQTRRGYCMALGTEGTLAVQHPAKLRHAGDKAKLISANDTSGYTFRGRFLEAEEAVGVGFEVTQKAHNALRWLIARQGSRNGDQVFVSWVASGAPVPDPMAGTYELLGIDADPAAVATETNAGQAFALRLKRAIAGYRAKLEPRDDVLVMGLDSATTGRMAVSYYREILGSEFLQRVEAWHLAFAWPQNFGKDKQFVGAPSPRDVAQAAFGRRLDEKLEKATCERLLPCIVDAAPVPNDLVNAACRRAANRMAFKSDERWEWEKCLGIACALFKGEHLERNYSMALELDRTVRDYLFGRLLAIAERIESYALFLAGEKRDTTAARMMQRFADRPHSAWRTIELSLAPYKARLRNLRPGFLHNRERELDEVLCAFMADDFMRDAPLTAEFLLGYHCQRAHRPPGRDAEDDAADDQPTKN